MQQQRRTVEALGCRRTNRRSTSAERQKASLDRNTPVVGQAEPFPLQIDKLAATGIERLSAEESRPPSGFCTFKESQK
jgi:hypothetical protein